MSNIGDSSSAKNSISEIAEGGEDALATAISNMSGVDAGSVADAINSNLDAAVSSRSSHTWDPNGTVGTNIDAAVSSRSSHTWDPNGTVGTNIDQPVSEAGSDHYFTREEVLKNGVFPADFAQESGGDGYIIDYTWGTSLQAGSGGTSGYAALESEKINDRQPFGGPLEWGVHLQGEFQNTPTGATEATLGVHQFDGSNSTRYGDNAFVAVESGQLQAPSGSAAINLPGNQEGFSMSYVWDFETGETRVRIRSSTVDDTASVAWVPDGGQTWAPGDHMASLVGSSDERLRLYRLTYWSKYKGA